MAAADRVRTFFALWPDTSARVALARLADDVSRRCGGRAPRALNLHITLAFVGDVERSRLDALGECGERAARSCEPFALDLDRIGGAGAELAWIAPSRMPPSLLQLHATLAAALASHGFPVEQRAFRPHVTLARRCTRRATYGVTPAIGWNVDRLALVGSVTGGEASTYSDIAAWPLRALDAAGSSPPQG